MNAKELPSRPSLEQYKKQAKDLVKGHKCGDAEALRRVRQFHPRFLKSSDSELRGARFTLADAQLVIAREHAFESWPKFVDHIQVLNADQSPAAIWKAAEQALIAGDIETLDQLLSQHAGFLKENNPPPYVPSGPGPHYHGASAREIILREQFFASDDDLSAFRSAQPDSPLAKFESAVDAIVRGDVATLERLLSESPELIRARSTRSHHSTLLHYIGANGVEGYRQKTPRNAVEVLDVLLRAGADVGAVADMYGGGCTPFLLVATSIHPYLAGVQDDLMIKLIDHGAVADGVRACLANGRGHAAEFLAARGAPLDLEGAAGVGRLDLVREYFDADGKLMPTATEQQLRDGFAWACEFGRADVVEFLLDRGVAVDTKVRNHGQTGLHWAAVCGHVGIAKLLLARNSPVNALDDAFKNNTLGWALHGWGEAKPGERAKFYEIIALLLAAGAAVDPQWLREPSIRDDVRLMAMLSRGA